ncbi:hypothetical protein, partial [Leuconostoc mesenteroides]|uniref:hypothetical protein n=1 Tax=Leuconostoc mesenteroides TaxID=1245 RepID=UPI00128C3A26
TTQLAITTKGFSAVCSVRLILAIYLIYILLYFIKKAPQRKSITTSIIDLVFVRFFSCSAFYRLQSKCCQCIKVDNQNTAF